MGKVNVKTKEQLHQEKEEREAERQVKNNHQERVDQAPQDADMLANMVLKMRQELDELKGDSHG